MILNFSNRNKINPEQLGKLYNDVEWYAYTQDLVGLQQAIEQSLEVISVWKDDELVGLIRVVGDGLTIIYIQDILVLDRKSTRLNSSHVAISYAVFCLKKKSRNTEHRRHRQRG